MQVHAEIEAAVRRAPQCSGCYFWKSKLDDILYIGKAQNLRARLQSYLREKGNTDNLRIQNMLAQARSIEWITTQNENEALLLEANLVKKHAPRFNVRLKDDKRYPYLCLSLSEKYPQLFLTRRRREDGNLYYGPYSDVKATRATLAMLHKIFPIRKVRQKLPLKKERRPCINFHIQRCLAPCQGNIPQEEYRKIVDEIVLFLDGKTDMLETQLQERMASYSKAEDFEKAAIYRDMIRSIRRISERQVVQNDVGDEDVLGIARRDDHGQVLILEIRQGRLIGRKSFPLRGLENVSDVEVIEAFIRDYYLKNRDAPGRIQVPLPLPVKQKKLLTDSITKRIERKVHFFAPRGSGKRQEKFLDLARTAKQNAELLLQDRLLALGLANQKLALEDLRKMLKLKDSPHLMECYDISHIQGSDTVAAGVLFIEGRPQLSHYRHYRIKTVKDIDDPASLREVIDRRIRRLLKEERKLSDIFLIDGGAAQVNAAYGAARALGKEELFFIGLAKKREELYFPNENKPHRFDPERPAMRLLRHMRNEAHRFALQYHRKRRKVRLLGHALEKIDKIGRERKKAILKHFTQNSPYRRLEEISRNELAQVPGIGAELAKEIHSSFKREP